MGQERRRHPRKACALEFYCYLNGQRFDSASVNISEGGAFLATNDGPPPMSLVIVIPKSLRAAGLAVALVGMVRRQQQLPVCGVGVEWMRCVSRRGEREVREFLRDFLEIPAARIPEAPPAVSASPVAAFNFRQQEFYVPDVPPADEHALLIGPLPGEEITAEHVAAAQPAYGKGTDSGIFTDMLRTAEGRVPIDLPLKLVLGNQGYNGRARAVSLQAVLATMPAELTAAGAMVVVHFPVPLKETTDWVRMLCAVTRLDAAEASAGQVVDLRIVELLHENRPGIFERFVRYLCHRMLSR